MEKVSYGGWPNCLRLSNGQVELIVTTDIGPRVIRFGFVDGQNLFKKFADQLGQTGGDEWLLYGGHRFWHAPESDPRTYYPDNVPVDYNWESGTLKLIQSIEETTGIQKEIDITLAPDENKVTIVHRLTNRNLWAVELAPWGLTVMAQGGRAILPQEEYRSHPEYLLPARPLVLWHYTDMADPRWIWGTKYIQLKQDPDAETKQKVGLRNSLGWAAYCLNGDVFLKRYNCDLDAIYPDFGCNTEVYTDADMLEVESLGPLAKLQPDASVEHIEQWSLHKLEVGEDESEIDEKIPPLLT
ncbi:hypothetical protein ACFL6S_01400 [Candidatus Poribacteria bacterium]